MSIINKLKNELKEFGIIENEETVINVKYVNSFSKNKITYKKYEVEYSNEYNEIWHKDIIVVIAKNLNELQQIKYSHFWKTDMCFVKFTNNFYYL